jgi:hypothetical protein
MHQAHPIFKSAFPGLEMSPMFHMDHPDYAYTEHHHQLLSRFLGADEASVQVPVFERLSEKEELRLGSSGLEKKPVGRLLIKGECRMGCAQVQLTHLELFKQQDGKKVWEHNLLISNQ